MPWTTPSAPTTGTTITSTWGTEVTDDLQYLYDNGFTYTSSVNTACTAGTTSSATYVDIPGTSITMSFTKKRADTNLMVTGFLNNVYNTSAAFPTNTLGVSIGGTDYDIATHNGTGASTRMAMSGVTDPVTGVAAGAVTIKLRIKCSAGTFTTATDCIGGILVVESVA